MNRDGFLADVQALYNGRYTPIQARVLAPWLLAFERAGGNYSALFDCLTESYSTTFGKLPDKAIMVQAKKLLDERRYAEYDPNALPPPPQRPDFQNLTAEEQAIADEAITGMVEFFASRGKTLRLSIDDGVSKPKEWNLETHQGVSK